MTTTRAAKDVKSTKASEIKYPAKRSNGRIRFTFHLHESVLEKLRDLVVFLQSEESAKYGVQDKSQSLSVFTEHALIESITKLEKRIKKEIPPRRNREVRFGRPRNS
jgi:hypothetical protein